MLTHLSLPLLFKMSNIIKGGVNADIMNGFFGGTEWDELFQNPDLAAKVLASAPVLQMIKGVDGYVNKNLTVEEVKTQTRMDMLSCHSNLYLF